jgi:hypothetical protein
VSSIEKCLLNISNHKLIGKNRKTDILKRIVVWDLLKDHPVETGKRR